MGKFRKVKTLEEDILILMEEVTSFNEVSVAEILNVLSEKGRLLVIILFSLPFCQPVQIPGMSTPFGLIIAMMGLGLAFGKRIWLPQSLLLRKISAHTFNKIADVALAMLRKINPWVHPRLSWVCNSSIMEAIIGLIFFISGLFLALPLPIPLTNLIAAWSIFLIGLGVLENDGLLVIIGTLIFICAFIFFMTIAINVKSLFF